jgi:shikimate dehydrogenase
VSERAWWPGGSTRLVGIVGHPVAQVKAPRALTQYLRDAGVDAVVLPFDVSPADLKGFLAGLARSPSVAGLVVTIPHKASSLALADASTDRSRRVGAANVLRRRPDGTWSADILDGVGFLRGLQDGGFEPSGRRALVVGAGGVGSAIAVALSCAGADVLICDTDHTRAVELAGRVPRAHAIPNPDPSGCDLAVNATPMGMCDDDPLPFDPGELRSGAAVAEVIMQPTETRLMKIAAARGLRVFPGRLVLDNQLPMLAAHLFPQSSHPEARAR